MWIEIGPVKCRITNATPEETSWVASYLSFKDASRNGRAISLFNLMSGTFPGGLLPLLQDAASRDNVKIELLDRRISRITPDPAADLSWLYDYQLEAVEACVVNKRGIVRSPTGSGKSEIFIALTRALPGRWLMLVHRDNLVEQAARRYKLRTGLEANILSRTPPASWSLQVGFNCMTLQSLAAGLRRDRKGVDKALANLDGVIVDEAHTAPADVYFNAINRCPAEYRLGFSGTPLDRTDNRSLMAIAALGKVIYSIKAKTLIDRGVLAMPQITMVPVKQQVSKGASQDGFHGVYDEIITGSEVRNEAIVNIVRSAPKPCMVFVKIIDHGKLLKKMLEQAGISCEFVWGNTKSEARIAAITRLERRDSDVMVASVVLQEGVDIPSLESVVVGSGGRSIIATLQRIGRGMRTNQGTKTTFQVFDILDMGTPMMERHARRRMNTYVRESYQTTIKQDDGRLLAYQPKLRTRAEKRSLGLV